MSIENMRAFIIRILFYLLVFGIAFAFIKYALPVLMPFLVAFFIAFILQPLIKFVCKKTKISQKTASILLLVTFYIVFLTIIILIGTQVVLAVSNAFAQLPSFYSQQLEPMFTEVQLRIESFIQSIVPYVPPFFESFSQTISTAISSLIASVSHLAINFATSFATQFPALVVKFMITIIASFFFVADYNKIVGFIIKQLPENISEMLFKFKTHGIDVIFQFGRAYLILLSITCVELIIGLSLLQVENAIISAFLIAIIDILPVLGTGTILIPWALCMIILGNFPMGIGLVIIYAIITVVRQTLEPRVVGKQIGLYPLITLICMFVGVYFFGIIGMFCLPIFVTVIVQLNQSGDLHLFK